MRFNFKIHNMAIKRFALVILAGFLYSVLLITAGCRDKSEDDQLKLTTLKDTRLGSTVAYSGGTVTSGDDVTVTSRGVCWSNLSNPTISDNKTDDGSGPGYFESTLRGLAPKTTYYARMYAILNGSEYYGDMVSFETNDVVTDIDGNIYNTVTIGRQVWTVENLQTTRYQNGDLIPTTFPATLDIKYETNPKYQWACNGDQNKVKQYGRIYTWYTAVDPRKICPVGWHIPSDEEWTTLKKYLIENRFNFDGLTQFNEIGKSLASASGWGFSHEKGAVGNADFAEIANKTGFTALPGGYRDFESTFQQFGNTGGWWSSTEESSYNANCRYIYCNRSDLIRSSNFEFSGLSVRCVKDK